MLLKELPLQFTQKLPPIPIDQIHKLDDKELASLLDFLEVLLNNIGSTPTIGTEESFL